jgi:hypothetical protein
MKSTGLLFSIPFMLLKNILSPIAQRAREWSLKILCAKNKVKKISRLA